MPRKTPKAKSSQPKNGRAGRSAIEIPRLASGVLPRGLEALHELAVDLRWTWSHAADRLWESIDADSWNAAANPWVILQTISERRLRELAADAHVRAELRGLVRERTAYLSDKGWYRRAYPDNPLGAIAYFSMEFGLGQGLPLYAGGLGVLAGDFLKTASDLGIPLIGVGLLYQEGYFRQVIDADGNQSEAYPFNDPAGLPVFPARTADGGWLRIALELPGRLLWLRVWLAQVGRVTLYLLDSNDPLNTPRDRGVTAMLYDPQPHRRLLQEMALGIGGWRVLDALSLEVAVCHLNEGHAAFAVLERARSLMKRQSLTFDEAFCATRAGNVFTSHTPVAAAFDSFSARTVVRHFRGYAEQLGISMSDLLALGQRDPSNPNEPFNMAFLMARGSLFINGVSRLHGEVSRTIFQPLFPRWPGRQIPIGHITNGVHAPSWDSESADELWTRCCGKQRWLATEEGLHDAISGASDAELWTMRCDGRRKLVDYARRRLARQLAERGADPVEIDCAGTVLNHDALTLGFARRFTEYKRPHLLLSDPARFARILTNPRHKVQLVVAGKAHPADDQGKNLVRMFARFAAQPEMRSRVVFLEDYDIGVAQQLVQGVDVWINTPRRPWEACGTSGMKILVNGGLNLSELDGWWAEAYAPAVGWAVGDGLEHHEPQWDLLEAAQLYEILETRVIPEFYDRDAAGLPRTWLARIRESIKLLATHFSGNRMMREYLEGAYFPATATYRRRMSQNGALARELNAWQDKIGRGWPTLRFGELHVERTPGRLHLRVQVFLGELDSALVQVQLYADPVEARPGACLAMTRCAPIPRTANAFEYEAAVSDDRPAGHYTPRIIPYHPEASVPLENWRILWFR